jgi:uncharacterized membrane protein YkvA (DUF1232 family)
MSETNDKCLEIFPGWLESLGDDLHTVIAVIKETELPDDARQYLLGSVNYLFKSLDLIPDGIDDIGYLDDAFVIRLSAMAALEEDTGAVAPESLAKLGALAKECMLIEDFLGEEIFARLEKYTRNLRKGAARGRMVTDLMENSELMAELLDEADTFVEDFKAPTFAKDEKNLIKLTAFFEAKLPQ